MTAGSEPPAATETTAHMAFLQIQGEQREQHPEEEAYDDRVYSGAARISHPR